MLHHCFWCVWVFCFFFYIPCLKWNHFSFNSRGTSGLWRFCGTNVSQAPGRNRWDDWVKGAKRCFQRGELNAPFLSFWSLAPHSGYWVNTLWKLPKYASCIRNMLAFAKCWFFFSHLRLSQIQFDIDGDGSITSEELRNAMIKLLGEKTSKNEIEAVVKEADNNGDGTVDFEGEVQRCANTQIFKKKKKLILLYLKFS